MMGYTVEEADITCQSPQHLILYYVVHGMVLFTWSQRQSIKAGGDTLANNYIPNNPPYVRGACANQECVLTRSVC